MAVALGKRKRRVEVASEQGSVADMGAESKHEDLQDVFRRAFEAKFKPLRVQKREQEVPEVVGEDEQDINDEESDWSGISEPEDSILVVEHASIQRPDVALDKQALKAFMSSKPPSSDPKPLSTAKLKANPAEDDNSEAANLKNDLALQRLLNESHLLQSGDPSSPLSGPSGRNRHKATDLRLLALGSKSSSLEQKNMPLAHRKGIQAKAVQREDTRRKEAKENGVILERAVGKAPAKEMVKKRERNVGGPSVGRFKNGTLMLSKSDVASIQGPGDRRGGSRGGGRGRGRGGGRGGGKGGGRGRGGKVGGRGRGGKGRGGTIRL